MPRAWGEKSRGERGSNASLFLCLSFFLFLLFLWALFDHPDHHFACDPRARRVWLRALAATPTHRAGATRRGRCDATGREARKEDLDAERLCISSSKRRKGG